MPSDIPPAGMLATDVKPIAFSNARFNIGKHVARHVALTFDLCDPKFHFDILCVYMLVKINTFPSYLSAQDHNAL